MLVLCRLRIWDSPFGVERLDHSDGAIVTCSSISISKKFIPATNIIIIIMTCNTRKIGRGRRKPTMVMSVFDALLKGGAKYKLVGVYAEEWVGR